MGMSIGRIAVGQLEVNCYIVSDDATKEAMVIDPGDEPDRILDYVTEKGLMLVKIVCTHTHFDHIGALPELKESLKVSIAMHKDEVVIYKRAKEMAAVWGFQIDDMPAPDVLLTDGDEVVVGGLKFKVL
ncbi:MAG: MBL fold metallo-hydrolase, partial [Nitrospirae bacterium]|nr:MBL fold metallo-hydrolase [Nitrospirota bacterium]